MKLYAVVDPSGEMRGVFSDMRMAVAFIRDLAGYQALLKKSRWTVCEGRFVPNKKRRK